MSNAAEYLIFDVAGVELCLPLEKVEEVVPATTVTPLPKSAPFLLGVAAVRGRVLGVIDAAKRYGIGPAMPAFFMICKVREATTAVYIDRPLNAGMISYRLLSEEEKVALEKNTKISGKFIQGAIEVMEKSENETLKATGRLVQIINPDLFVSNEMASRLSEG